MKNKSAHHKSTNTFKFQPFSERIANIDVDIFHRVINKNEEIHLEAYEGVFYKSLEKWEVLNLAECYCEFRREIKPHSLVTLPQVLYEQQRIVDTLIKHLEIKNVLSVQPLLEHVLAVSKDVGTDFYKYFSRFFKLFLDLLNTRDADVLEWTFNCLAYLFKLLWRPLIKDLDIFFLDLLPLLSDNKAEYINNFAAECFAFVTRKVKDRKTFLNLIIKCVKDHKQRTKGCGQLLFYAMSGVNDQLHSYSESFFPFLLDSILDYSGETQAVFFDILEETFLNIVSKIHPQRSEMFWKVIVVSLDKFIDIAFKSKDSNNQLCDVTNLNMLLMLVGCAIEYKSGRFLKDPSIIIQRLIKILSNKADNIETIHLSAIKLSLVLLNACSMKIQQEDASNLTLKILALTNKSIILYFIDNINGASIFETLILPTFLKMCCTDYSEDVLYSLTKLIIKKTKIPFDGINLLKWKKYPLQIGQQSNADFQQYLHEMLKILDVSLLPKNMNGYICATICLPYSCGMKNEINTLLCEHIKIMCKSNLMQSFEENAEGRKLLLLINFTLQSLLLQQETRLLSDLTELLLDTLLPLCRNSRHLIALKTVDLILSYFHNQDIINMNNFKKVHRYLECNFSSPYNEVRLLTTHIYSIFEVLLQETQSDFHVFTICYNIESISPQVGTYRDQLKLLESLSADKLQTLFENHTNFAEIPLRYLCGVLYFNFKLLWEPVIQLIATYANAIDINTFWHIFGEELKLAVQNIKNIPSINETRFEIEVEFLNKLTTEKDKIISAPDYLNYRLLLWKAMELFPNVAEARSRDVSELFLKFYEEEYIKATVDSTAFCNIKQYTVNIDCDEQIQKSHLNEKTQEYNEMMVNDISTMVKDIKNDGCDKAKGKIILKTFIQHLSLFSKIRSPLSMYRHGDLYSLYTDLLSHKNHQVQKLALSSILCYKNKHLTPYSTNLYNLIDANAARNEMTSFRLDVDGSVITEEHRATVVPVVIRLAFSKLKLKVGGKGQNWRGLVVRFVGGCTGDEMLDFVRITFKQYDHLLADHLKNAHDASNLLDQLKELSNNVDLTKFIHPKRLMSALNLLQVIFDTAGLLTDNILRFLLRILLVISSIVHGAYNHKHLTHTGYNPLLRLLKNQCQKSIGHFFDHFCKFPFRREELMSTFEFCISPYIEKLPIEGVHSPTTLLRIILQSWGSNPRFFPLLNVKNLDGKSVMPFVMELLSNDKCNVTVMNAILDMVQRLLTLIFDRNSEEEPLDLQETINDCSISHNTAVLNYGSLILLPHVHQIMDRIRTKLTCSKSKVIGSRDLSILSRISELISEESLCNQLLDILLPICIRKCSSGYSNEEVVQQLLYTIKNLLQHSKEPSKHLRKFLPLFGMVALPNGRKIICETLKEIMVCIEVQQEWLDIANLCMELNAYDSKWIDQPDFQRRFDAFKEVNKMIGHSNLTTEMGVLVIHNCYYVIANERDLSLKDSATNCIKIIIPKLLDAHPVDNKYIIDETLFALLRASLKHQQDDVRAECIGILGHLARTCPKHHAVLRDLHILTNSEDPEVDFFENIVHMQVFRQSRALVKLCQIFRQQTQTPSSRTLTQFILPLITQYLCNERYASKHTIIDSAIDAVSVVCRLLPWHQYEGLLKYYLAKLRNKIEYQKQLVKLMVAILDNFHFDLSKAQDNEVVQDYNNFNEPENQTETAKVHINADSEDIDNDDILILESVDLEEDSIEENATFEVNKTIIAVERVTTLCKSSATRIIFTIKSILLPQLHRTLAELSSHEEAHKVNRSKRNSEREEDDLLRVPISLAVVKLLQKLPKNILDSNLSGILMKLCSFLRSPLESVRRCTRETLQKIITSLGSSYLPVLLDCITPLLSKGFQSHVLVYTVHAVLSSLRDYFKVGDIDDVLDRVSILCMADLFGTLAEEKEIGKIGSKTSEAKSTKSFDTLQILALYSTENKLLPLIMPLKEILLRTRSHKIVVKIQTSLRHISHGLIENKFITNEALLVFSYGVSSESIPQLQPQLRESSQKKGEQNQASRIPESCLIIPKPPERHSNMLKMAKVTIDMNSYILVGFGLNLCYLMLKRDKLREESGQHGIGDISHIRRYLDPFISVFEKCLSSSHVKLYSITMQCLTWIIKYDLPSMKDSLNIFVKAIFSILHKYASAGLSKGDNFDLVVATFKTISTFLRRPSSQSSMMITLSDEQLTLLLMYVEQDLHSSDRQATAFHLLRAILARRPSPPPIQLHDVILKTAELSVRSEMTHVRTQARNCVHQYMIELPIGKKKLDYMIGWYVNQLSYDLEHGRLMVIEMLDGLVYAFPQPVLKKYSGTFLMTLGARLINDDSPECRKKIANTITTMFKKLPKDDINDLFNIIILWFGDNKVPTRQLAVQLIGILINVEKSNFEHRLTSIVSMILAQFRPETPQINVPGRLVKIQPKSIVTCNSDEDNPQTCIRDHYIFLLLKMLQKLASHCPTFLQNVELIDTLSREVQILLGHEHEWVRLGAAQFLGYVLASINVQKLVALLQTDLANETKGYLYSNPQKQIKSLTLDLCAQLEPGDIRPELAEQIVKNLVFLAQILQYVPVHKDLIKQVIEKNNNKDNAEDKIDCDSDNDDDLHSNKAKINLMFLTKRMRKIVNREIVETPSKTTLRTEVFKWIAAVCKSLNIANVHVVLYHLMAPLIREMNTLSSSDTELPANLKDLRQLATDVAKLIKNRVGIELYTETIAMVQRTLIQRRAVRKRVKAQLALTDPEMFAKKKLRRHEKKRVAKKRKIATLKMDFRPRKQRQVNFDDNSDVI